MPRLERYTNKKKGGSHSRKNLPSTPAAHNHKLPLAEGFANEDWDWPNASAEGPNIAFIVTTAESVYQIKVWMAYHRALGVTTYYLFVEGQAGTPEAIATLRQEPGVTVIPNDETLQARHAGSRIWSESWLYAFFNKPCNHELFVRQSLNMEMGIELAQAAGVDWLLHVDTDELMYPAGTQTFSLKELLGSVPDNVDALVFPNYESLTERTDVEDPFTEVTLFKRSYSHVHSEDYFSSYGTVARGNPNYFTTYGNGKSAARVQPGMRPNGAHRWHNYIKEPTEWSSDQAAVLHYTYNRFSDLKSRRDRCDCKPTEEDAERCFILPFDRLAFLEASLKNDDQLMEWFKERLVWEDLPVVVDLVNKGLFSRLYEPQIMIRGLKEAMKRKGIEEDTTNGGGNIATGAAAAGGGGGVKSKSAVPVQPGTPAAKDSIDAGSNDDHSGSNSALAVEQQRRAGAAGGGTGTDKAAQMQQQRRQQQEISKKALAAKAAASKLSIIADQENTTSPEEVEESTSDENANINSATLSDRDIYLRETADDAIEDWKKAENSIHNGKKGSRRELTKDNNSKSFEFVITLT